MATNGLVSVRKDGEMVMKIVVGCEGQNAPAVAKVIRMMKRVPTMKEARNMAKNCAFGCESDRVVVTKRNAHRFTGEMALYQSTLHDPNFNPRWQRGTAEYTEIVNI